ncbi:hypothetical protein BDE02_08G020200 [Populus trichocarpa]|nr:hypothetical protein BDE02_08G020200 [Populus trichocarpa]
MQERVLKRGPYRSLVTLLFDYKVCFLRKQVVLGSILGYILLLSQLNKRPHEERIQKKLTF